MLNKIGNILEEGRKKCFSVTELMVLNTIKFSEENNIQSWNLKMAGTNCVVTKYG